MRTFWDFVKADIQITVRNRQALFWTFFFPVLLMFLLGVVFGQSGSFTTNLAIVDQDRTPMSSAMVSAFQKVDALKVSTVAGESQALKSLRNGDYAAVLVLPAGLQQRLAHGRDAAALLLRQHLARPGRHRHHGDPAGRERLRRPGQRLAAQVRAPVAGHRQLELQLHQLPGARGGRHGAHDQRHLRRLRRRSWPIGSGACCAASRRLPCRCPAS